jgi:hypothetical protein
MIDANECREPAERCMTQAAQATDPIIKNRLTETAQGWLRLAADLAKYPDPTEGVRHRNRC